MLYILHTLILRHILLLIMIIVGSYGNVSTDNQKTQLDIHWLVLHYHKTGHDLTRALFEVISKELGLSLADNKGPRRTLWKLEEYVGEGKPNVLPYFQSNVNIQGGAEMHFKWKDFIKMQFKVLHFVRDPFDYVISAYLYHSQSPPPPEKFVRQRRFNPCMYSKKSIDVYLKELGLFHEDVITVSKAINGTIALCESLHKHGPLHKELQHLAQTSVNEVNALQLEACRSIISDEIDGGGDLLRMTVNALRAKEAGSDRAKTVYLHQFPLKNETIWRRSLLSVLEFLLYETGHSRRKLSGISDVIDRLVNSTFDKAFVKNGTTVENSIENTGVHVTSTFISSEKRQIYLKSLKEDPVLGPLLLIFQRIILDSSLTTRSTYS